MESVIKKTDISDSLTYDAPVAVELLCRNGLWEIEVPHIVSNGELIQQLRTAEDPVDQYAEILSDSFKKYHYEKTWRSTKHRFICSASTQINKAVVLPSTIEISDDFTKYGITRKSWEGDDYCYRGFGTVVNGKLLSWCIENTHFLDDNSTIIGVRTDENNRRNGYAVSNVAALCNRLQSKGISNIYYECDLDNIPSYRTARKANLEYIGEVIYLGFQK